MSALAVALGTIAVYLLAYHTYGRWLSRHVFRLDPQAPTPAEQFSDGCDFVPTRREIVFGHHFTSIAGTGPIVGPAIAVFWGWLPALLWVLVGNVFIGAVHDLGALVVSLRSRGQTVGEIAARVISPRARLLFLVVLFLALMLVLGIFGLVIAAIFAAYPSAVFPIWIQIPIAIAVGLAVRRGANFYLLALVALVLMIGTVAIGAYWLPINLTAWGVPATGVAAAAAGYPAVWNTVVVWTLALLVYCFFASVLPVWLLLQPRDFVNANQLLLTLGAVLAGICIAALAGNPLTFVAPALNPTPPADAPPMLPFLFITIACGAVSGFHCLVSSGTSSKQLRRETDATFVGYGAMLLEGGLAVVVILACCAALGGGVYSFDASTQRYIPQVDASGAALTGEAAWAHYYGRASWASMKLSDQIGGFIEGGANLLRVLGIPVTFGISLMAVLVACFAATTLDTATRLQRYVVSELGGALRITPLKNRYVATSIAVVTGGGVALISGPVGPGSGGMILWPIFGATNQLLAGLSFLVIAFYLLRHRRPIWFLVPPAILMVVLPTWAMGLQMFSGPQSWWARGDYALLTLGLAFEVALVWIVVEALLLAPRVRGVLPAAVEPATG